MGDRDRINMGCSGSKDPKEGSKEGAAKPEAAPAKPEPAKDVPSKPSSEPSKPSPEPSKPAPAAPAQDEPQQDPWMNEDLNSMMNDYFTRYDLDGSGTINSNDELKQLCTNLVVKLELDMDVATIDQKVNGAGNMEELCWDFETFKRWFVSKEQFAASPFWMANDVSDSDELPESEMAGCFRQGTYKLTMKTDGMDDVVFDFKLRYRTEQEEDKKELLPRVYNDEVLGYREMNEAEKAKCNPNAKAAKVPCGLHTVTGSVDNKAKKIHIEKSYDVDRDASTKEPHFVFDGSMKGDEHTTIEGEWKDIEEDPAAAAIRGVLKVGTSGTFTLVKNKKED